MLMTRIGKILLWLSMLLLVSCSIDLASPTHKPPEPIYIRDTPIPDLVAAGKLGSSMPPAWAGLKLSGHLIYVQIPRQIVKLDLASGLKSTLFDAPGNAFVSAAQASPDGQQLVLAYAPSEDPALQSVNTDLYVMPADGSTAPQVLLKRADPKEDFFNPVWSPDGKYIYYSHLIPDPSGGRKYTNYQYDLERVAYPGGQPEKVLDSAFWPRLSPDGSKLAYVSFVPSTNSNDLYIANADGSQPRRVMPAGAFFAVDAPLFSPDGQTILFSAVGEPQVSTLPWLDQLLGVQVAEAHTVPSDWWSVPTRGGKAQRLTHINGTGLYADFAPDGQHVAFASITGLYVMQPGGNNLVQLLNEGLGGTLSWTP
jgi:Tol biopolymer transport system component